MSDAFMRDLDAGYRTVSDLYERRFYKIFYSHIHPFPLLVLGQNPGGETDGTDLTASQSYFENWEHDFVRFRFTRAYSLASPMCRLLSDVLNTKSVEILRQVPVSNVIFRRSRRTETLSMPVAKAARESSPFVSRIIKAVDPRCILFISKTAFELFSANHCERQSIAVRASTSIFTANGRNQACVFMEAEGFVLELCRRVQFLVVGHPSKYSGRVEWKAVTEAVRLALETLDLSPIERALAPTVLPPLPEYSVTI